MKAKQWKAICLAVLLICLPVAGALATQYGTVHGGWLILRATPSFTGTILSSYPTGTVVTINGQTGSWYEVTAPDGMHGYMLGTYLTISSGSGGTSPATGTTAYVTSTNGLNVRLRTGPGLGYSVIASYAPGTVCTILSRGTNWSRIQIGSLTGYMMNQFLTSAEPIPTPVPEPQPQPEPTGDGVPAWVTSTNGKGVNLRSGPGKTYASIGFYSVGTDALILTPGATWSYIRIGSKYGYMMSQFLTTTPIIPPEPVSGPCVVSANGRNVNMRTGPGKSYAIIGNYPVGTPVTVISRGMEWYFIRIGDTYGYMMKQYINDGVTPPEPLPATPTDMH